MCDKNLKINLKWRKVKEMYFLALFEFTGYVVGVKRKGVKDKQQRVRLAERK
jgi:hypothetical protein